MLIPVLVVLLVVAVTGIAYLLLRPSDSPSVVAGTSREATTDADSTPETDEPDGNAWPTSDPTSASDPTGLPESTDSGTVTIDAETTARTYLDDTVAQDEAAVAERLDGRYVVKLASKVAGTTDPLQTTASGSHTFGWADVQAEYEQIRRHPGFGTATVLMTRSDRIGKARVDPASRVAYYVTIADIGATSRSDVTAWCRQVYATDSDTVRNNKCMPMELTAAR